MRHALTAPLRALLRTARHLTAHAALSALAISGAGCSVHALTGDTMSEYTTLHLTPYLLSKRDVSMACEVGVSLGPYLLSFERVTTPPDQAAVSTLVTAALCAEQESWTEELRALRAFRAGDAAESQDARVAQRRAHGLAAARYAAAYDRMTQLYPEGPCAELDETGELTTLLGLLAGVLAVQNDRASGVMVGVPTDTPRKVAARTRCFNDAASARWWGLPRALEAAVWLVIPGSGPEGVTDSDAVKARAYAQLTASAALGRAAGVRVVDSVFAYAAYAMGDLVKVKAVIAEFAASRQQTPPAPAWALLDETSFVQLQALSDKLWTEARGHRTPLGELGAFWEEPPATPAGAGDDLLEGLDAE
jgi:hypothetical protein